MKISYLGPKTEHTSLFSLALTYLEKNFHLNNQSQHYATLAMKQSGSESAIKMSIASEHAPGAILMVIDTPKLTFQSWFSNQGDCELQSNAEPMISMLFCYSDVLRGLGADRVVYSPTSTDSKVTLSVLISQFKPDLLAHIMDCAGVPRRVALYNI